MADARAFKTTVSCELPTGVPKPPGKTAARVTSAGVHSRIFSVTIAQIVEAYGELINTKK
jgi:hypothetical protein